MNRESPVPFWAVLTMGVFVVAVLYLFGQSQLYRSETQSISEKPRTSPAASGSFLQASNSAAPSPTVIPPPFAGATAVPFITTSVSSIAVDTSVWNMYHNSAYGFEFRYSSTWKIKDNLKPRTCCLDVIKGGLKAQFSYTRREAEKDNSAFVKSLVDEDQAAIESGAGMYLRVDRESFALITNANGVAMIKYTAGDGELTWYEIPLKHDFSQLLIGEVWNYDHSIDGLFSSLRLTQ